jgi:DNA-binding NtrC family response regulator
LRQTEILVVDDEPVARLVCSEFVRSFGYEALEASSCVEAERLCQRERPHVAILDYQLGDGDALGLILRLHEIDPALAIVVLTARGSIELAVEVMRQGANHFLTKPIQPAVLKLILERCLSEGRQRRHRCAYDTKRARHQPNPFSGESAAMRKLERMARSFNVSDGPMLLIGETGCGKGVLARWLHDHGTRAGEPFIELNCAGLKPEFLESELFGYKKGAFTGATDSKPGLLQIADRGTLFLDEIGDMDLGIQAKLLKVLEDFTFRRLGDVEDRRVDVRLIAATHHDLAVLVQRGAFRADLYYRIHTLRLRIPPLRDRLADLPRLVDHFLSDLGRMLGRPNLGIKPRALAFLKRYPWPGNVRELRNAIERAILMGEGETLDTIDFQLDEGLSGRLNRTASEVRPQAQDPERVEALLQQEDFEAEDGARQQGTGTVEEAWEALRTELRRQVEASRNSEVPLGRWLIEDLLREACAKTGGIQRQAALLLGMPNSTFARQLRKAKAASTERPRSWEPLGPLLKQLLDVHHPPGSDLALRLRHLLLDEVLARRPKAGPALMGVSPPTFRRWRDS